MGSALAKAGSVQCCRLKPAGQLFSNKENNYGIEPINC